MGSVNASVDLKRDNDVAIITIENPPVNALKHDVRAGLIEALKRINDPAVKAVVLTGAGRAFSAGADISEFGRPLQPPGLHEVIAAIEATSKPVVAAIHGTALGGGLELALACHYRVANRGARVGLPEIKLGILPGAGGTQRLPRAIGKAKAMDLVLTGRMMDAAEAERSGLVSRVVPADRLMDEAIAVATVLCALGQPSLMMAKEAVNRSFESGLSDGVAYERRLFQSLFGTEDQREGAEAFLAKRPAAFKHR